MKTHVRWLLLLTTPIFGFTNCSYFSDVTVPAVDTAPPYVGSRVYSDELSLSGQIFFGEVALQTNDPHAHWTLVPWATDAGGLRELFIRIDTDEKCCVILSNGVTVCQKPLGTAERITHWETGEVGDTVSDGHYDLFDFKLSDYGDPSCDVIRFGYLFTATDFAGNVSSAAGSVTYTNPVPDEPMTETPPRYGDGPAWGNVNIPRVGVTSPECTKSGSCFETPPECLGQPDFKVEGTWECDDNRDVCVFPAQGVQNSYCSGAWEGEGGSDNPKANCGKSYGSLCVAGDCYPGTICNLQSNTGTKCGLPLTNFTTGEHLCPFPKCWPVNEKANLCADDWIL